MDGSDVSVENQGMSFARFYDSQMSLWAMELNPALKLFPASPQSRLMAVAWGKAATGDVEEAMVSGLLSVFHMFL
jgi:hypothetical protein